MIINLPNWILWESK